MSLNRFLAPIAAAAALVLAPAVSQAGLMIQITDGTTTLTVADGNAMDGISATGAVSYSGAFGGWMVTAGFGSSFADPLAMHLSAMVIGDRTDGRVWIKFTQTDLDAALDPITFHAYGGGSSSSGAVQSNWAGYVDDGNVAFGTGQTIFGSGGFATAGGTQSVGLNGTYSATLVADFDYSNIGNGYNYGSSLDLSLVIPEPTTLALLGLGLAGLGVTRRRRS